MTADFCIKALFAIFSIAIAASDIKTGAVPRLAFAIAFPVLLTAKTIVSGSGSMRESSIGLLIGLAIFLLAFFFLKARLGLADVWYSALTGMMLGPLWWYAAVGTACAGGIIYMIASGKRQIPFIPFMAAGSITVIIIQIIF